jgi:vacuolar protein sorting-associated protein 41
VLNSDCTDLSAKLQRAQVGGFSGNGELPRPSYGPLSNGCPAASPCPICQKPIQQAHQDLILVFLCGHMVHAHCTSGGEGLPKQMESSLMGAGLGVGRDLGAKIA